MGSVIDMFPSSVPAVRIEREDSIAELFGVNIRQERQDGAPQRAELSAAILMVGDDDAGMRSACARPFVVELEEVCVVGREHRPSLGRGPRELPPVVPFQGADLVSAQGIVTASPEHACQIGDEVFIKVEARPHGRLKTILPCSSMT